MMPRILYKPTRPELQVQIVPGGVSRMSYSETLYEVVSRRKLNADALAHLDAAGVLGIGQAYGVIKDEEFEEEARPSAVDASGNELLDPNVLELLKGYKMTYYVYHRYVVRRICDSGD